MVIEIFFWAAKLTSNFLFKSYLFAKIGPLYQKEMNSKNEIREARISSMPLFFIVESEMLILFLSF
jgi:hypothetical protein